MNDDLDQTTVHHIQEPTTNGAPAEPVTSPATGEPSAGRTRWLIAGGVVAVVVALSVAAFVLFTGQAGRATVLGYVPNDSIMYGEARLDLPGDQRMAVGEFLSRFPGFADQSIMETKIDEVLDRLLGAATDDTQTFSSDIKPWFGGELAFSVGALPDPGTTGTGIAGARFLILASVKDGAAASAWFDGLIAEQALSPTTETYGGATIHEFSENGEDGAFAVIDGKVAVAGDPASVRAAVDTRGEATFDETANVKTALDAMTGDHVGFAFIALRPLLEWSSDMAESAAPGTAPGQALLDLVPEWGAFALRVEGDALRMEAVAPQTAIQATATVNRSSVLAERIPASTVALSISHDYGRGLLDTLETYRSDPELAEIVTAIDQAIGFLGGPDAAIGWVGDVGVVVTNPGDSPEGGLVVTPTDSAAAGRLFTSLRTLISLGGAGMGFSVRDEDHGGTTITIVDLGDLGDLGDLAGVAGAPPGMLGGDAPINHVELAYAVTDDLVILGSGPGFVRSVLDTTTGTSLASTDRFKGLVDRVGDGSGLAYADLTAIRELIERTMADSEAADLATYESEVRPFLVPFDALIATTSVDGELNRSTTIVTVK